MGSEGEGDLKGNPLQQVCQIENSKDSDVKCHKEFNFKLNFEWKENGNLILESLSLSLPSYRVEFFPCCCCREQIWSQSTQQPDINKFCFTAKKCIA